MQKTTSIEVVFFRFVIFFALAHDVQNLCFVIFFDILTRRNQMYCRILIRFVRLESQSNRNLLREVTFRQPDCTNVLSDFDEDDGLFTPKLYLYTASSREKAAYLQNTIGF